MHGYILKFYNDGFHRRNDGFLKNGIAVSYARTAGTWEPEYSDTGYVFLDEITFNNETWYVYENPYYLGMAYLIKDNFFYASDVGETLERYNQRKYTLLFNYGIKDFKYNNTTGQSYCEISLSSDATFILSIPYSSTWKAYIDEKQVDIQPSDMYMSIDVPKGEHEIRFVYSYTFNVICWSMCALVILYETFRRVKRIKQN